MILFESLRPDDEERRSFHLDQPEVVLQCHELAEVAPLLREVEKRVAEGYTAAGFLCYEAGFAFLPAMPSLPPSAFPLAWFGLSRTVTSLDPGRLPSSFGQDRDERVLDLALNVTNDEYADAIGTIREWIERGHTYQVNFTMRYRGAFRGSPRALYRRLRDRQRVHYAAYLETDDWSVISLSPELFFRRKGNEIVVKPMKGTAPRGRTNAEDALHVKELQESAKERSENLMIVDMLRNDLGRICETGSIEVTDPMRVEKYETLLQMTTTVGGRLKPKTGLADVFGAAFPCGSVTGAPKVRTMQIIHELERAPRGVYTGAIGIITPDQTVFSVAIRTAVIDRKAQRVEMGVGSGILYEADSQREYQECILKGRFLTDQSAEFQLLETILWTPQSGLNLLEFHLERLSDSARYFLFDFSLKRAKALLAGADDTLRSGKAGDRRIRLLVARDGSLEIEIRQLEPLPSPALRVRYAGTVDSSDPFLYHKTTQRSLYERELKKAKEDGYFDVLFRNEKGHVTEGAISNVLILKNGVYFTPPVSCGLLAGTVRRHLLESRPFTIEERILTPEDFAQADAVFCSNALRGLVKVELDPILR
jgi:para-aminobenzoate synthetase/4-amino-4-deoxychorismate lyase